MEPEEDHVVIPMLEALPPRMAEVYREPRACFREEAELPHNFKKMCQRYSRFNGPRKEWIRYLHRQVARRLWRLLPESEAVATESIA